MLCVLISCELKEFDVTTKICEGVIGLGVSEAEFQIWNSWKAPGGTVFTWELRGQPKFENLRLIFKSLVIFIIIGRRKAGYVYAP